MSELETAGGGVVDSSQDSLQNPDSRTKLKRLKRAGEPTVGDICSAYGKAALELIFCIPLSIRQEIARKQLERSYEKSLLVRSLMPKYMEQAEAMSPEALKQFFAKEMASKEANEVFGRK